ncbi:MAG: FAD-binding oxidoreductase, partial [Candidatus Marinimicrobia bacterium]|nr:FAD-binding oxidoreductase [Candidatus Neomarinimicrobiota bacterium]
MNEAKKELIDILPKDSIEFNSEILKNFSQDRAIIEPYGNAIALVMPKSKQEILSVVKIANKFKIPIVPRGAGTGLTGGSNAIDNCILLSLHRLNKILSIDVSNRMAIVEPGVINSAIKEEAAKKNLFYPPDPASYDISSIGGNVATNAGGLCCVKYGVTRDYVMGLEVVLGTGEVINTGRKTIKNTSGYDFTGIFIGSEGTLGIITKIILKLLPTPPISSIGIAYFNDLPNAGNAILEIFNKGFDPNLMEIIDKLSLIQVEKVYRMSIDTNASCVIMMQTNGANSFDDIKKMLSICIKNGAYNTKNVNDPKEGEKIFEIRRKVWPSFEKLGKSMLPEDVAVPRQNLAKLLQGIIDIGKKYNVEIPTIGHAGDGNLHPLFVFDHNKNEEVDKVRKAFVDIINLSLKLGGTIAGEHGIGTL